MWYRIILGALVLITAGLSVLHFLPGNVHPNPQIPAPDSEDSASAVPAREVVSELATFGSGCFWCSEAVFLQLKGVEKVVSGYSGGTVPNPTYQQVCTGKTGHAEVIQVSFDPKILSYPELLEVFWQTHDPTTPNRQGNDVGPQYRSVIFYHSERQHELAERYRLKIDEAKVFKSQIVTEIVPFSAFYAAENYHQNYYANHARQPYCQLMIGPKLAKLKSLFQDRLKTE
jgi:peptide-methionine (S)-S-oxide reductase